MEISFAGKGGSGKTTTLSRVLARRGQVVRAIDGDSNPNLAVALGIPSEVAFTVAALPPEVARFEVDTEGKRHTFLNVTPDDLFAEHGFDAPDGVRLLVGSRIAHAGAG